MAFFRIEKYMARWNYGDHFGEINIGHRVLSDLTWKMVRIDDAAEFSVMVDLLRNETPMYYSDTRHSVQTAHGEGVGEGESD